MTEKPPSREVHSETVRYSYFNFNARGIRLDGQVDIIDSTQIAIRRQSATTFTRMARITNIVDIEKI